MNEQARKIREPVEPGAVAVPLSSAGGSRAAWSTKKLAEFVIEVGEFRDEKQLHSEGLHRVFDLLDAEIVVLLHRSEVLARAGHLDPLVPPQLVAVAAGHSSGVIVDGVSHQAFSAPLEEGQSLELVAVLRSNARPTIEEITLFEGLAGALGMGRRALRVIDDERANAERHELNAADNARLLAALRERQELLESLAELQRDIVGQQALTTIFQSVVTSACHFVDADVAVLRLLSSDDPELASLAAVHGADVRAAADHRHAPIQSGICGSVFADGRLLSATDREPAELEVDFASAGLRSALVVPVRLGDRTAGYLGIASRSPFPKWAAREQRIALSFGEHTTLALNHADALETAVHESLHDVETGLPNRRKFLDEINRALKRVEEEDGRVAAMVFEIDNFGALSDSLGPEVGRALVATLAERAQQMLGPQTMIARLGRSDLGVLVEYADDPDEAVRWARKLVRLTEEPILTEEVEVTISISVGIATSGSGSSELLRNAEVAMHRAQDRPGLEIEIFEPEMRRAVFDRVELELALRRALDRDELHLNYQPIFALAGGRIVGLETLARWDDPERGLIEPSEFIALAERSDLICRLGLWVLEEATAQAASWHQRFPSLSNMQIGVNISAHQLRAASFVDEVREALARSSLPPGALTLEITESVLMEDTEESVRLLTELSSIGVSLAIDDFGIGHSSLQYLSRFPLDTLKIDRYFVQQLGTGEAAEKLVQAMVYLAEIFNLNVVAEGIEDRSLRPWLIELGCEFGQGFEYSEPLSRDEVGRFLARVASADGDAPIDPLAAPRAAPGLRFRREK